VFFEGPEVRQRLSRFWILITLASIIAAAGVAAEGGDELGERDRETLVSLGNKINAQLATLATRQSSQSALRIGLTEEAFQEYRAACCFGVGQSSPEPRFTPLLPIGHSKAVRKARFRKEKQRYGGT